MSGSRASSTPQTTLFAFSGVALTCTLSLSGGLAGIAMGLVLALPLYWMIGRTGLPARAAQAPRLLRLCAWGLAVACAAFFALGLGGELAVRFSALASIARWGIASAIGALSVHALQVVLCALLTAVCSGIAAFARSLSRNEICFLILWTALLTGGVVFIFIQSTAFDAPVWVAAGTPTPVPWNAIYSVDTPSLLEEFAAPGYAEVRHPLFTLLVFPLGLAASIAGKLWPLARPMVLAIGCGMMLSFTALLLWRMTRNPWVAALYALSHPVLIYSLCTERYQLSVLLLVLSAHLMTRDPPRSLRFGALIAAAGATATSAFLAPMLHSTSENFAVTPRRWPEDDRKALRSCPQAQNSLAKGKDFALRGDPRAFRSPLGILRGTCSIVCMTMRWAGCFVMVCILAGRGAVLLSAFADAGSLLGEHAGVPLSVMDRLAQYSSFVAACFVATPFGKTDAPWPRLSWLPVTGVDWVGAALLALCVLGFVLRRRERFAQICGAWMAFSVLLLPIIGWGGGEFPFFSIYFSWAALPLACFGLDGLIRRNPVLRLCAFSAALVTMACLNLTALAKLMDFATDFYPR